jgi:hypothetical protein
MALKQELMASGMSASLANKLGFDPATVYAAAGTTQGTATVLTGNVANVTTVGANSGVILGRPNERNLIYNGGSGNVLTVYPPVGGTILGLAKNAGLQVSQGKAVTIEGDGTTFFSNLSA